MRKIAIMWFSHILIIIGLIFTILCVGISLTGASAYVAQAGFGNNLHVLNIPLISQGYFNFSLLMKTQHQSSERHKNNDFIVIPTSYFNKLKTDSFIDKPSYIEMQLAIVSAEERTKSYKLLITTRDRSYNITNTLKTNLDGSPHGDNIENLELLHCDDQYNPNCSFSFLNPQDDSTIVHINIPLTSENIKLSADGSHCLMTIALYEAKGNGAALIESTLKFAPFKFRRLVKTLRHTDIKHSETGVESPSIVVDFESPLPVKSCQFNGVSKWIKTGSINTKNSQEYIFTESPSGSADVWTLALRFQPVFKLAFDSKYTTQEVEYSQFTVTKTSDHNKHLQICSSLHDITCVKKTAGSTPNKDKVDLLSVPSTESTQLKLLPEGNSQHAPYTADMILVERVKAKLSTTSRFNYNSKLEAFSTVLNQGETISNLLQEYNRALRPACDSLKRSIEGLGVVDFFEFNESRGNKNATFVKDKMLPVSRRSRFPKNLPYHPYVPDECKAGTVWYFPVMCNYDRNK